MGRPKNTIPSKQYAVCMPIDLAMKMELHLYSELEGRIPQGNLSGYINDLVRKDIARIEAASKQAEVGHAD